MPIGQRWFAWIYGRVDRGTRSGTAHIRAELVGDLTGDILEIGCGLGANFAHYPAAARVIATDYSEHMLKSARTEAASESVTAAITIEHAEAAALRFPDASFDTVVSTLVLCSVRSQAETLQEIRRVLRPGGELRIWEHVHSDNRLVALGQTAVTPLYSPFGDGCHLNRDTAAAVRAAGFEILREARPSIGGHPLPNLLMIARKPAATA